MAKRSIEETFRAIKPKGSRGIPDAPVIGVGVTNNNGDLSTSLSQAGQQIAQLQAVYQQQAALIKANTEAIQGNTAAKSGHSAASAIGGVASSFLGGALGFLSPLISGIAGLFGGDSAPAPLPVYTPPSPVSIDATLRAAAPGASPATSGLNQTVSQPAVQTAAVPIYVPPPGSTNSTALQQAIPSSSAAAAAPTPPEQPLNGPSQSPAVTHVTVNVSAMDSQSFMDRSADIASAVREAMLNLHPINDVVANL